MKKPSLIGFVIDIMLIGYWIASTIDLVGKPHSTGNFLWLDALCFIVLLGITFWIAWDTKKFYDWYKEQ